MSDTSVTNDGRGGIEKKGSNKLRRHKRNICLPYAIPSLTKQNNLVGHVIACAVYYGDHNVCSTVLPLSTAYLDPIPSEVVDSRKFYL